MDTSTVAIVLGTLLVLVFSGIHLAVALGVASCLGLFLVTQDIDITINTLARTSFEGLREYTFAALPLFMLMGEFISRSGAAGDLYSAINRALHRLPGRLALATVLGNAVFSFLTGVSIAAAAAFTRFAYPQMREHRYHAPTALGLIAGSSCLGMLIPPSNLMIIWAILVEESIGRLFLAGIIPGLLLVLLFSTWTLVSAWRNPDRFGEGPQPRSLSAASGDDTAATLSAVDDGGSTPRSEGMLSSVLCITGIIVCVLGGIWFGFFTATEAAGVGALLALAFSVVLKGMRWDGIVSSVLTVGRMAGPLMIMVLMAMLFSKVVALTGIGATINGLVQNSAMPHWMVMAILIGIWFVLGMLIDSKSILLLTVPLFAPIGGIIGYDPIAFAIIGILAIETGLLTPPFGIIVFVVKTASQDDCVTTLQIFRSAIPFWIMLLILIGLIIAWPSLATGLGDAVFG